ncbi:MAG: hypothetical protein HY763_00050 [Planctomycetes bacterium]|nr:hypothetical protein [Planctomycetota bacterium]
MFARTTLLVWLVAAPAAYAGGLVDLRLAVDSGGAPITPSNPDGTWNGGESLVVEFWLTPSTSLLLRSAQVDVSASSAALTLGTDIDTPNQPVDGIANFWFDYTGVPGGTYPADAGGGERGVLRSSGDYVDFSNLSAGDPARLIPPSTIYIGPPGDGQKLLPGGVATRLGGLAVTLPTAPGTYTVDLLSPGPLDDVNRGASIAFGFGLGPGDPFTTWSTATGDPGVSDSISYAPGAGPVTFVVVPEAVTLAMLGLGVLAGVCGARGLKRGRRRGSGTDAPDSAGWVACPGTA